MTKHIYITGLALILAACSNGNSNTPDATTDAPVESDAARIVDNEPTGMSAGAVDAEDMDYTRITFEKGAVSAQVSGNLAGFDDENVFVIDVAEGQVMTVKKATDDAEFISLAIINPFGDNVTDMDAGCNGNKTNDITQSGDYSIVVTQCMKADPWNNDYKLDVTVK